MSAMRFIFSAVMLITVLSCSHDQSQPQPAALASGVEQGRTTSGRLAGTSYAPRRSVRGTGRKGAGGLADLHRLQEAARAEEDVSRNATPENLRRLGKALLVLGEPIKATQLLEDSVAQSPVADGFNDLAVAYLASADDERPDLYPKAADMASRAVRAAPSSPVARFNLALTLERLHLNYQAIREWAAYLDVEREQSWRVEALERVRDLETAEEYLERRRLVFDQADRVIAFPQEVLRLFATEPQGAIRETLVLEWVERRLLAEWVKRVDSGTWLEAQSVLSTAATLCDAGLAGGKGGEFRRTLDLFAATLDRSSAQGAARTVTNYLDGLQALESDRIESASRLLTNAAAALTALNVPLRWWAEFHIAAIEYARADYVASRTRLETIERVGSREGLVRLVASTQRSLAMVDLVRGDNERARDKLQIALQNARRANDLVLAGRVLNNLASTLDLLGQRRNSWATRLEALELTAAIGQSALAGAVYVSAAQAVSRDGHNELALTFMNSSAVTVDALVSPVLKLTLEARQAEFFLETGDREAARASLERAEALLAVVHGDPRAETLEALIAQSRMRWIAEIQGPDAGISEVDHALNRLNRRVPARAAGLRLRRARLLVAKGDAEAATSDLRAAIELFERVSTSSLADSLEATTTQELVGVARLLVAVLIDRGDARKAREIWCLLQAALEGQTSRDPDAPPDGEAILQYAVLDDRVIGWAHTTSGLRHVTIDSRAAVAAKIRLDTAVLRGAEREELDAAFETLYDLLIGPFETFVQGARRLVVIPDDLLGSIPFASLRDRRRDAYLFESTIVEMAWTVPLNSSARTEAAMPTGHALVVADPGGASHALERLTDARREGETIAGLYASSTLLQGDAATATAVLREFKNANIIHWAGHAVIDDSDGRLSYFAVSPASPGADRLTAATIARARVGSASTVILAACRSADSPYRALHARSLGHAFHRAGARHVVGVSWEIPDRDARAFFEEFHRRLSTGLRAPEALQSVQRELIRSRDKHTTVPLAVMVYVS
jgi:CHAT domain-containing protein